jgi:hypothetical protein
MCASCGCGEPENKHGDDRNINWSEIEKAARANDISPIQVAKNIQEMAEQRAG